MSEIALMLPQLIESTNVQETIQLDPCISKAVTLEDGFVVLKGYERLFLERSSREKTSKSYRGIADDFIRELRRRSPYMKLMAVCGSVAYGSAKKSDDIDLFILTQENRMWLTFFKALLLARIFNIKAMINGKRTDFCLSYMQDQKSFEEEIIRHKNPLFAREFLSLYVVDGMDCYRDLLGRTSWMSDVFPKLYALRMVDSDKKATCGTGFHKGILPHGSINLFVYILLGRFLRLKAFLRNSKYRKQGKLKDLFKAIITQGCCVYTSERYRELENLYNSSYSCR
jgi:predicted nucleotidyltransferase